MCCSLIYLFLLSCVVSLSDYHFHLLIEILTILHWRRGSRSTFAYTMASVGKIESFDPNHETFPRYVQRVRNFFAANGIDADKKKYVFLNSLGRKHYNGLYELSILPHKVHSAIHNAKFTREDLWHYRYGHLSMKNLQQ